MSPSSRELILDRARAALGWPDRTSLDPPPPAARVPPRTPADADTEIALALAEVERLGGRTQRVHDLSGLHSSLADLVRSEDIRLATLWPGPELAKLGMAAVLDQLGVEIVPPDAGKHALAACDLGITGVDAVVPETGTLLLRTLPEQPQLVSLLPRIHLAIFRPAALRADLHQALAETRIDRHATLLTGPSRTADIEKVITIGVHGPRMLYVWCYEG